MPVALLIPLIQWGLPEIIKLIPGVADDIRMLLSQGDNADWSLLDKYKKDFATAFPHADIGNTD